MTMETYKKSRELWRQAIIDRKETEERKVTVTLTGDHTPQYSCNCEGCKSVDWERQCIDCESSPLKRDWFPKNIMSCCGCHKPEILPAEIELQTAVANKTYTSYPQLEMACFCEGFDIWGKEFIAPNEFNNIKMEGLIIYDHVTDISHYVPWIMYDEERDSDWDVLEEGVKAAYKSFGFPIIDDVPLFAQPLPHDFGGFEWNHYDGD